MKRVLSFLICLAILAGAMILPTFALDGLDSRELESKGQQHIYIGSKGIDNAPRVDGKIENGEYRGKASAKFIGLDTSRLSSAYHYFDYDDDNIYIAIELIGDKGFAAGKSGYEFNLAFPTSGGFSDYFSRVVIDIAFNTRGQASVTGASYLDQHNGSYHKFFKIDPVFVTEVAGAHNTQSYKTVYEFVINKSALKDEAGVCMTDRVIFYTKVKNSFGTFLYHFEMDETTREAIAKAYPEHAYPRDTWTGHVVHFSDRITDAKINTLDCAAVKDYGEGRYGLRFKTVIDKEYLDGIVAEHGAENVKVGTLIMEKNALRAAGGTLTKEALPEGGYLSVIADVAAPYEVSDSSYSFVGSVTDITDRKADYLAVGYVEVNGAVTYSANDTERTVSGVAYAALRDISKLSNEEYKNKVRVTNGKQTTTIKASLFDAYSPYTEDEMLGYYKLAAGYNLGILPYYRDALIKEAGDIRVATSNVYCHNFKLNYEGATAEEKNAAVYLHVETLMQIDADVLCLQEVSNSIYNGHDYRYKDRLEPMLITRGYTEVDVKTDAFPNGTSAANAVNVNYTPIWYKSDVLTLIEAEHVYFTTVGYNPDGGLSSAKSYTWALFEENSTGKKFIVISSHMTSSESAVLNMLRMLDASEVMQKIAELEKMYNVPVMVLGDFNTRPYSDPYKIMLSGNLVNANRLASDVVNAAYSTFHSYPGYSWGRNAQKLTPTIGADIIDHIFVSKEGLNLKNYQTFLTDNAIISTDHVPLSIDFTLN